MNSTPTLPFWLLPPANDLPSWLSSHHDSVHQHPSSDAAYIRHGWKLVPIPHGRKGPIHGGWNERDSAIASVTDIPSVEHNIGLLHAYSGTMALDIDDYAVASYLLAEHGINLDDLFSAPDAVTIESGRSGHGKLLYAMPPGVVLPKKQIHGPFGAALDFRCSDEGGKSVQDVLPPSIHPDTGKPYSWGGKGCWTRLPQIPEQLLKYWSSLVVRQDDNIVPALNTSVTTELQDIKDALAHISPDCNRKDWINVGAALQHYGKNAGKIDECLSLWNEWSKGSPGKYKGEKEILSQWKSFKSNHSNPVTAGTLFKLAKENGYTIPHPIAKVSDDVFSPVSAVAKQETPKPVNPLLIEVNRHDIPLVPKWVIPGFIAQGVVVAAGAHGVGKTTTLLPLAMHATGLMKDTTLFPKPDRWRHVVYIAENTAQASTILKGLEESGEIIDPSLIDERIHLVSASRSSIEAIVEMGVHNREKYTRVHEKSGVRILPLVVFDTKSAIFEQEDENDNAETSKIVAALKQKFEGMPLWIISHTAKNGERSVRGASSLEADSDQVLFVEKESKGNCFIKRGKTRFEATWEELSVSSHVKEIISIDEYGDVIPVTIRWNLVSPPQVSSADAKKITEEEERLQKIRRINDELYKTQFQDFEQIPNDTAVVDLMQSRGIMGNRSAAFQFLRELKDQSWVVECVIDTNKHLLVDKKRSKYIIGLTSHEREAYTITGELPDCKMLPPVEAWNRNQIKRVTKGD